MSKQTYTTSKGTTYEIVIHSEANGYWATFNRAGSKYISSVRKRYQTEDEVMAAVVAAIGDR